MRRVLAVVTAALLGLGTTCGMGCAAPAALLDQLRPPDAVAFVKMPSRTGTADQDTAPRLPPELEALFAKVTPSLVEINRYDSSDEFLGAATGVVLNSRGLVVTNNHVIIDVAKLTATRSMYDNRSYPVTVLGTDPRQDLAVLQLHGASRLPAADLGDSDTLRINQRVATVGNGLGRMEIGAGPITRLRTTIDVLPMENGVPLPFSRLREMTEALSGGNPGDSGGALVTTDGAVIGINQGFASGSGYAIPINKALQVVERLTAPTHR